MIKLIKSDFSAGRYFVFSVFIYIPFIVSIMIMAMLDDFAGIVTSFFLLMLIALCTASGYVFSFNEALHNGEQLFASLPLTRTRLVLARYLSSLLLAGLAWFAGIGTMFAAVRIFDVHDPVLDILISSRGAVGLFSVIVILISYGLPFYYRYRHRNPILKAAMTPIIFFVVTELINQAASFQQGIWKFHLEYITSILNGIKGWIFGTGYSHPLMILGCTVCVAVILSLTASIRFFKKRDI